ncbi:hypothetical protein FQN53_007817 [Emmonsiellopsis sp. PD_33]|nr:hypothetical protein FQN53_007817 [Emmonsiellopsis sp. PD_33]
MVQNPCVETVRPLYSVMKGICANLLEILPEETMTNFQTQATKILRNMNDHVGSLLCFAMFARVTSMRCVLPPGQPPWFQSICHFFDATRGMKTLDLIVLRAILSCSGNTHLSVADSIECLELAKEVCDSIDVVQKNEWIRNNKPKVVKLCEKILKPGTNNQIQMMGLVFLSSLLPPEMLPNEIVQLAHAKLVSADGRDSLYQISSDLLSYLVDKTTLYTDFATLVLELLTTHQENTATEVSSERVSSFVGALMKVLSFCHETRPTISSPNRADMRPHSSILAPTLHKHVSNPSQNWRSKLAQALTHNAQQSHQLVIEQLSNICKDFEFRCENVEEPLRAVTARLEKITTEHEACEQKLDKERMRANEAEKSLADARADNSEIQERLEASEARVDDLASQLQSALDKLRSVTQNSKESVKTAEDKAQYIELKYMAIITAKDDTIEEQREQIEQITTKLNELETTVHEYCQREIEMREHSSSLQYEVDSLTQRLKTNSDTYDRTVSELDTTRTENEMLRSSVDNIQSQLDLKLDEINSLKHEAQVKEESYKRDVAALNERYGLDMSGLESEMNRTINIHKEENRKLQQSLQTAKSKAAQAIRSKDERVKDLQLQLETLKKERDSQAREFAKVQEYSNRLMAVFNAGRPSPEATAAPKSSRKQQQQQPEEPTQDYFESDEDTDTKLTVGDTFYSPTSNRKRPSPKRPRNSKIPRTPPPDARGNSDTIRRPKSTRTVKTDRRQPLSETGANSFTPRQSKCNSRAPETAQSPETFLATQPTMMMDMEDADGFSKLDFTDENIFTSTDHAPPAPNHAPKPKRPRRSRGRGDPRNARMREEAARDKMLARPRTQRGDPSSSSSSRRPHHLVPIHAHIQPAAADESVPRSVAMGDGLLDAVQSAARQQEQYSITHQHAHAHQPQYQYQHHPRRYHHHQQQQQQPRAQFHPLPPRPVAGLDPSWSR